jgi:alkanesulfonate monooxygenase SsuD/methylene tetrahydromethanopterin reductase-like flavin-dependent oxidoreductase (luciferase family)
MRVGIAFTPFETRTDVIFRLAARADDLGLDRVDVAEGWTHDSMILLAEIAQRTTRIGIGTSVISSWGRTPATIALGAAGLQRCSGGRFSLGIGASSQPLTEGLHGIVRGRPVTQLRETVTAVRALLDGERLPYPAPGARPLRLGVLPEVPIPIVLAALSTGSIRLAGELADAWAPFLWARSRLDEGRELLEEGAARAQDPSPTQIAVGVPAALASDERGARRLAAWWLSAYATRMGPLYPQMLSERFGMATAVEAVVEAAAGSREPELPAAAEDLAHEVTLMGSYDRAIDAIAVWFAAGADSVQLVLPPGRPIEELAEIVEVAAAIVSAYAHAA